LMSFENKVVMATAAGPALPRTQSLPGADVKHPASAQVSLIVLTVNTSPQWAKILWPIQDSPFTPAPWSAWDTEKSAISMLQTYRRESVEIVI
jgi:hypothetical protein